MYRFEEDFFFPRRTAKIHKNGDEKGSGQAVGKWPQFDYIMEKTHSNQFRSILGLVL